MLTSLDFLEPGSQWPPPSELERLQRYDENRKLFEGKHEQVFDEWIKLLRADQAATLELILNWHKRLSLLWADLLLGEPPNITAGDEGSKEQKAVKRIIDDNKLILTAYEAVIDISRFGDGPFKVRYDKRGIIEAQQPSVWFPVVKPDNIKDVMAHVLAYEYKVDNAKYLKAEIHEKGRITTNTYILHDGQIGALIDSKEQLTGVDEFLVVPASNIKTTDRIYGKDDYEDLDSIIQELEIRVAQISRILDKHADPNMYGPDTALERDENGQWIVKGGGKYFPLGEDEKPPGYVTWDGQLEAAFKQIDLLMEQLYILTETSAAAFGQLKSGLAESGTALRRLLIAPLAKTNRIRMRLDPALKEAIKLCSELEVKQGMKDAVLLENIDITWQDGLPDDDKEQSEIYSTYTQNGIMSKETAIKRLFGLSGEQLQQELDRILVEANQETPTMFSTQLPTGGE